MSWPGITTTTTPFLLTLPFDWSSAAAAAACLVLIFYLLCPDRAQTTNTHDVSPPRRGPPRTCTEAVHPALNGKRYVHVYVYVCMCMVGWLVGWLVGWFAVTQYKHRFTFFSLALNRWLAQDRVQHCLALLRQLSLWLASTRPLTPGRKCSSSWKMAQSL